MTLAQTPAVRHYTGWQYNCDANRPHREHWHGSCVYGGQRRELVASTEAALKRKIDDWFDQQSD